MDSRDNFLDNLGTFINTIDDEYLIGLTNKGTVNRAKKDLDKVGNIEYEVQEECINFKIDDIECSIFSDVKNYKCSCPSRSMCKHIIMSYLYVMNNKACFFKDDENTDSVSKSVSDDIKPNDKTSSDDLSQNEKDVKRDFKSIKEYDIKDIKKAVGDKNLYTIIKRIEFEINCNITETSMINVDFIDENVVVKLMDDLNNSICSCKEKGMCRHKAEAIILYKIKEGYLTLEELKEYDKSFKGIDEDNALKACGEIKNILEEILISGLSRLSPVILDNLSNTAVICHNYDLPNFEKNIRDIREEINMYLKKDASFITCRLLNKITRLYMNAVRIEKTDDIRKIADIAGEFKSSYYEIPPVELYGIGAEAWETKSGYEGITYYFYENNKKQFFTFSKSSPVFYDNYLKKDYMNSSSKAPWNLNCTAKDMCRSHFKLVYGKINYNRRISSSSESHGFVIDETDLRKLSLDGNMFNEWKGLIEVLKNRKNFHETESLVFIQGKSYGECGFDNINQIFRAEVFDINHKKIEMRISFSLKTKKMIRTLERMVKADNLPVFLGRIYISDGRLMFYPISYFIDSIPNNLT